MLRIAFDPDLWGVKTQPSISLDLKDDAFRLAARSQPNNGISRDFPEMEGIVNVGVSHDLCKQAKFVASTGTSLFAPNAKDRTRLIAFVGVKTSF